MARIYFADMHNYRKQIISTGSDQLRTLSAIMSLGTIRIGEHVELQRELNLKMDFRGGLQVLVCLKSLELNT